MSVQPGNQILLADLQALAALANSLNSVNFSLANFYNVSPMYLDNNGNNWGYRRMSNISITAMGAGYKPGDTVSAGYGSVFAIEAVDGGGGVLVMRAINLGAGQYSDPSALAGVAMTGGSGAALAMSCAFSQVGPEQGYSFLDFTITSGSTCAYFTVNGGIGYKVGDTLSGGSWQVTVGAVDGSGRILSLAAPALLHVNAVSQQDLTGQAVTGGSGHGAVIRACFVMDRNPSWLTELNRLRANLAAIGINNILNPSDLCVSGPWPTGGPTANYEDTEFWYPDTGNRENVTVTSALTISCTPKFVVTPYTTVVFFPPTNVVEGVAVSQIQASFYVGGPASGTMINGVFFMNAKIVYASGDSTNPLSLITVDPSTTVPGAVTMALFNTGSGDAAWVGVSVNAVLAPGKHTLVLNIQVPNDTYTSISGGYHLNQKTRVNFLYDIGGSGPNPGGLGCGSFTLLNGYVTYAGNMTATAVVFNTAVAAPGIHNSKQIYKIQVPGDANAQPAALLSVQESYTQAAPTWRSNQAYNAGDIIIDHNGNTQQAGAGGGTSGAAPPGSITAAAPNGYSSPWATTLGGMTVDGPPGLGAVTWTCIALASPTSPDFNLAPFSQPHFLPERIVPGEINVTPSPVGFWTARSQWVSSLNAVQAANMPWNQIRTLYNIHGVAYANPALIGDQAPSLTGQAPRISNSYNNTIPVESQIEPPAWQANTYYTVGFQILDTNGNLQYCTQAGTSGANPPGWTGNLTTDGGAQWHQVRTFNPIGNARWTANTPESLGAAIKDSNGNTQMCVTAGITGATQPAWPLLGGQLTKDGTITWQMASPLNPAVHRALCVPRYPVYWFSETILSLMPPTPTSGLTVWGSNNQWQVNIYNGVNGGFDPGWQSRWPAGSPGHATADTEGMAFGWWIYSVRIDRMQINPAAQIPVTIGCMRNGVFVAFGTYQTGATYQVLWPIFTSNALVYQCTERVDLQAVAISSGGNGISTGFAAAGYPICAAFVADTTALLKLIT